MSVGQGKRWVKVGLHIDAKHVVTLRVPPDYRHAYGLAWVSRAGDRAERFVPCARDASGRWTFFAGGFIYQHPVCAPLEVQVDGRTHVVRFGLGINCPR